MATTDSPAKTRKAISTRRKLGYAALAVLVILLVLLIANLSHIKGQSRAGSAYAAHVVCSCRYIQGNDMQLCEGDKIAGMAFIGLSDDPENRNVTASVPFLAKAVAEYRGEYGCVNLNEAEIEALD